MTSERLHVDRGISVIIPTLGRPTLRDCLTHLQRGTMIPFEVLVVHQGDDTTTQETCTEFDLFGMPCRYLPFPHQRGAGSARNRGIERCRTRLLATIDDDCLADEQWLATLSQRLTAHPASVISGQVRSGTGGNAPSLIEAPAPRVYTAPTRDRDVLYTGCMGSSLDVFERVGLFSEARALLPAAEDNEWAYRVLSAGVPIRYEPTARVTHVDWRSAAEDADVDHRYAAGQGGFYGLYLRRLDGFVARRALRDLMRSVLDGLVGLRRRDIPRAKAGLQRFVHLVRGIFAGLTERTVHPLPGPVVPPSD